MIDITIKYDCKDYLKANGQTRKIVEKAMNRLKNLITEMDSSGTSFEKIFNNDVIKYDVIGKNFFTFKFRAEDKTQLRALYKFKRINTNTAEIELHKFYIKRNTDKSYIKVFEEYVNNYVE